MDEEQVSLGEFLKLLTSRANTGEFHMPLKDEQKWHLLFYQLKKEDWPGKPAFFGDLQFDWVGRYPICEDLSEYIHALHFTGCMSASNPSYDELSLNKELAERWARVPISGELPKFIERAAELAQREFAR